MATLDLDQIKITLPTSERNIVQTFGDRLANAVQRTGTPVLVGLDPRFEQLPPALTKNLVTMDYERQAAAYLEFCRRVIDVVAPLVPAVKPQAAFFEELGPAGMTALAEVIRYANEHGLLVIVDGKRNDIGSTATAYAHGFLGRDGQSAWGADALTISPYLGDDSLSPFVETARSRGAGLFVLVKTSNQGGAVSRFDRQRAAALSARGRACRGPSVAGCWRKWLWLRGGGGGRNVSRATSRTAASDATRLAAGAWLWQSRGKCPRRGRRVSTNTA